MSRTSKTIDDLIYNIENVKVEMRRKSPLMAIIIMLAGIAIVFSAYNIESIKSSANISSAFIFLGFIITVFGVVKIITCFTGKGRPYYNGTRLRRYEFINEHKDREIARKLVEEGDFKGLDETPRSATSAVKSVVYKTDDNVIAIAQTVEYVPHYYRPVSEIIVFKDGEFTKSAKFK